MAVMKRYVLRLFISLKYITANVVDRNNGRIVTSASTVEHSVKGSLECGRSCNAKAAAVVGEVLAKRLKVEGIDQGKGQGIHANVNKEIEKKGFKNRTKIWAIVNTLKNNGVKLILDGDDENSSRPSYYKNGFGSAGWNARDAYGDFMRAMGIRGLQCSMVITAEAEGIKGAMQLVLHEGYH